MLHWWNKLSFVERHQHPSKTCFDGAVLVKENLMSSKNSFPQPRHPPDWGLMTAVKMFWQSCIGESKPDVIKKSSPQPRHPPDWGLMTAVKMFWQSCIGESKPDVIKKSSPQPRHPPDWVLMKAVKMFWRSYVCESKPDVIKTSFPRPRYPRSEFWWKSSTSITKSDWSSGSHSR